jgi:hypothetical protein
VHTQCGGGLGVGVGAGVNANGVGVEDVNGKGREDGREE